jgi:hypothetical protein
VRGAIRACAIALAAVAACQFQPRGAEIDASGNGDDAATDPDATNNPDPDASEIDASPMIDARMIDARMIDARMIDGASCPWVCNGGCLQDGTCVITCGAGQCNGGVTCPSGRPCDVTCSGTGACEFGVVDCTQASSCNITCSGTDACDAGVNCAGTSCAVNCSGNAACEDGGVDCTALACSIICSGQNACDAHVCCNGLDCVNAGGSLGCQSNNGGCCSCGGCN